jgi:hypothetical protein
MSGLIPAVKSLENIPRVLEIKVSIQMFSVLIGNYFKRHSLTIAVKQLGRGWLNSTMASFDEVFKNV